MTLNEFRTRIKLEVPNIGQSGLTDAQIDNLINQAPNHINRLTKVYKTSTDFNIVAEQQVYQLSSVAPTYLDMDKQGAFFLDSNSDFQYMYPKTFAWINETYPNWINADSVAIPTYYWVDGDDIGFYPKPSTALTNGCRIYHLKSATAMDNNGNYPWNNTTSEIKALQALDDAIIAYVRWKLSPSFGQNTDADIMERHFITECRKGAMQVRRRRDLTLDFDYRMRLDNV